ncbi:hypothetical protein NEOLEDRAFT_752171 [Neolentinus lepideus HHB14362 ss-1]|uniref:Uncharacterized protein n=1 Tax=Neolentinus lepideus HHB14362 ss-1 TaxID=1314782 RepID=A0A165PUJ2_9AGAM|nr:hypothetical protein NEOLEDRAFT_752171 [Neolentinus lepideus HHB14362 ss-1]
MVRPIAPQVRMYRSCHGAPIRCGDPGSLPSAIVLKRLSGAETRGCPMWIQCRFEMKAVLTRIYVRVPGRLCRMSDDSSTAKRAIQLSHTSSTSVIFRVPPLDGNASNCGHD